MICLNAVSLVLAWTSCESRLRIIGGRDALQDEFPYVVRLEINHNKAPEDSIYNYFKFCTGAALTTKWVLSAAHCVSDTIDLKDRMVIRYNSYLPNVIGLLAPFLEIISHPGYNELTWKLDFLLIRSTDIKIDQYGKINAVDFKSLVGHEALTLGFGRTNASQFKKPLQVLKGMLSICIDRDIRTAQLICLVRRCTVKATICSGDSGGPIVHSAGIVGVNSLSEDNCNEHTKHLRLTPGGAASILSPVSPVLDWLGKYVK